MRIISGKYKGRKLFIPKTKLRPTKDFTKESLFNIIDVKDKIILDLFSGSGSIGIESISRFCKEATLVEINRKAILIIKRNLNIINEKANIFKMDVLTFLKRNQNLHKYDFIFLDPPYSDEIGIKTIKYMDENIELCPKVKIILETGTKCIENYLNLKYKKIIIDKIKKYGDSSLVFFIAETPKHY